MWASNPPADVSASDLVDAQEEYCRSLAKVGLPLLIATTGVAGLIVLLAFMSVPIAWLLCWLGMVLVAQLARNYIQERFTQIESGLPLRKRLFSASMGSVLSGMAFGVSAFFLPQMDVAARSVATLLLLALPTAGLSLSHGYARSFRPFLLCIVVPVALAWASCDVTGLSNSHESGYHAHLFQMVALLILAYGYALWTYARRTWQVFFESCAIRSHERALNSQLREALEATQRAQAERSLVVAALAQSERERIERESADRERHRLLQDLHDGVGSELSGALVHALAYVAADARGEPLVRQIKRAINNLKHSVDAMREDAGDITAVLGMLRHRIQPHLQAAQVHLEWHVDELPLREDWSVTQTRDLQLLLLEAFTNLLTHAQASRARFSAQWVDGIGIAIALRDDGQWRAGSNPTEGAGMRGMRERALRLNGRINFTSGDGEFPGLCMCLEISPGERLS